MKVNFYLEKKIPTNKDTQIVLTFHYQRGNGEKIKIKVSMRDTIAPDSWNFERQRPKSTRNFRLGAKITTTLNDIENFVQNTFRQDRDITKEKFIEKIKIAIGKIEQPKTNPKNNSVLDFLDTFIDEREKNPEFSKSIVTCYRTLAKKLKQFQEQNNLLLEFGDINDNFANKFKYFLFAQNLQPSTVKKYFKDIKTVMNNAFERGENNNSTHKRKSFLVKNDIPKSSIYLTIKELNRIQNIDLFDNQSLAVARDWFLIGCFTGLRVSDYLRLSLKNVRLIETTNGEKIKVIDILTQKTKKQVVIPMNTSLKKILQQNNNDFPTPFREQTINEYLKKLGEMAQINENVTVTTLKNGKLVETTVKKYEKLTTHVGRRTFITNLRLNGAPDSQINSATGHKSKEMINTYDRVSLEQNAEQLTQYEFLR